MQSQQRSGPESFRFLKKKKVFLTKKKKPFKMPFGIANGSLEKKSSWILGVVTLIKKLA